MEVDFTGREGRVVAWERPSLVKVDEQRGVVIARFPELDRSRGPASERILESLLRVARRTDRGRHAAIRFFVRRHGLLESPWSDTGARWQEGGWYVREEPIAEYVRVSALLGSVLEIHRRLGSGERLAAQDVALILDAVISRSGIAEAIAVARQGSSNSLSSLWKRTDEPTRSEFSGAQGDVQREWRQMQAERLVQLFHIWVRDGHVRPQLRREGTTVVAGQWSGGAWGALAIELQDVLTGRRQLGSCAFCGRFFEGLVKRPRARYAGQPVLQCCQDEGCARALSRHHTARSRARKASTNRG